ncbi:amidohydrolase family protein [Pacificimonas sp. WHA3]|uniref:Amidohydrolase family protein n=1 Tax=Pacificimonas pallii TaxID=2827236 RepID=A0ABS6SGE9_9SPHN|nr:amidohydrolase family protein [Pacificimonas pallii]MBV7257495.1 amidohydrolase family protein [Pacificimonas pallii]
MAVTEWVARDLAGLARRSRRGILVMAAMFASLLMAQAAQAREAVPAGGDVTAIMAGQIIDGRGGEPIRDGVIVIRGKLIEAVGSRADVVIPPGATIVDASAETVLPGLIDTHGHLNLRYGAAGLDGVSGLNAQGQAPGAEQMLYMVRDARASLLSGVTTMRMVSAGTEDNPVDLFIREGIEKGIVPGPRIIYGGTGLTPTGGHGGSDSWVDGPWEAKKKVRREALAGAEWLKILLLDLSPTETMYTDEELRAIIGEAHRWGMKVTVHATGRWGSSIKQAVLAGADNIEHARPMTREIIDLLVKHDVSVSLTPLVYVGFRPDESTWDYLDNVATGPADWIEYGRKHYFEYLEKNPEVRTVDRPYEDGESHRAKRDFFPSNKTQQGQALAAFNAGVRVTLGLDTLYYGAIGNSIEYLIEGGFKPMDAIRAGTAVSAEAIGYGDRIGTLEPGKYADLISLRADPLTERWAWHKINLVYKEGVRKDTLSWK